MTETLRGLRSGGSRIRAGERAAVGLLEWLVSAAEDAELAEIAEMVGRGLDAGYCLVEVWSPAERQRAEWPAPRQVRTALPIRYARVQIGVLGLDTARRPPVGHEVCGLLGVVLHSMLSRREVERQAEAARRYAAALGETRRATVAEHLAERWRLERNLHDGAQHHLVALRVNVGLLEHSLATGNGSAARERLAQLGRLLDITERGLVATAAGVLPPALVVSGLLAGFATELRTMAVRVEAEQAVRARRYPLRVEVAVFFACLEAVNNATKHAPGAAVLIRLEHTYRGLAFGVLDDGPGVDPTILGRGSGLRMLADRIAAAGGALELLSTPGKGTTVRGFIPI